MTWPLAGSASCRVLALLALLQHAAAVDASGWGGSLGLTSDYVYRGITQSDNQPAGLLDLHYYALSGWYAGLSASSVRRDYNDSVSAEFDPYLGYQRPFAPHWSLRLDAVHHDYPWNNPGRRYNFDEFSGTLAYADRVFATVAFSPDTALETRNGAVSGGAARSYPPASPVEAGNGSVSGRAALSYDLALHQPLPRAFSLNGGVGYYDLRWAVDTGYFYWNGGLGYDFGGVQLDLSYIGTDGKARRLYYDDLAVNRLVATALWHF